MQNVSIRQVSVYVARMIVAFVFLLAAVPKIVDPISFAQSIENYRLVEGEIASALALWVPWIEVVCAISLLTGFGKKGSAVLSAGLLLFFCGAISWVMFQGIDIRCGCFGADNDAAANGWSLLRNAGLIVLCGWIVFVDRKNKRDQKEPILI